MDAVEIGRRSAARIFEKAVSNGIDPWSPYDIALFAAQNSKVTVERVPKGHVSLHGARASYDPEFRAILHEETGSAFSDAFIISHEIGHVTLGDDKVADETSAVDEERVADAAPVGVDRVEDYGRNQRREIQMDLFARELLLPRARARKLHIDDGMTASDIADRLGARFAPVAQQLFDALLLPEVEETFESAKSEKPLNREQEAAAKHTGSPYLLEAGPGTGKTQTLVGRIRWLLSEQVDPRRILVLTFSNKAAGELIDRISAEHPEAAAAMWCGTFHAFGLDFLRRFGQQIGLPTSPTMIDRSEAITLLEPELPRLGVVHFRNIWDPTNNLDEMFKAVSRAKDEVVGPAEYKKLAEAMFAEADSDETRVLAEKCLEVARIYERYEELKKEHNRFDFGDLVALPVEALETHPDIRNELASAYEHILVDEYQDVNRSSVRLLQALANGGENLWVVGDVKQSIYRFRGASSFNIHRYDKSDFVGAEVGCLSINYRSSSEIVDAFSDFAERMKVTTGRSSRLSSDRGPSGRPPEFRLAETANDEIAALADAIDEMMDEGHAYREQAILCTGNDKLAKIGAGLESMGIPVLYLGSIFERSEIKDLLSMLSLVADEKGLGLTRIATLAGFEMPLGDVALVIEKLRSGPDSWVSVDLDSLEITANGKSGLEQIRDTLAGFGPASRPWDVLSRVLLDRSRIAASIGKSPEVKDRAAGIAIWQFLNFMRATVPGPTPITGLFDRIRRLIQISDERDLRQLPSSAQGLDAVRLMTIHGSKGLEFPVVHLPGLSAASLPRSAKTLRGIVPPDGLVEGSAQSGLEARAEAHDHEQECLFYVAISRARDRLIFYAPSLSKNGRKMNYSPFIDKIVGSSTPVFPTRSLPRPVEEQPIDLCFEGTPSFTNHQLHQYDKCPRRFFYTHVLRVGGRQVETSFARMHNATRTVVDWMVGVDPDRVDMREVETRLEVAFQEQGFVVQDSGDYLQIARSLLASLHARRTGLSRGERLSLRVSMQPGDIVVQPDETLEAQDGRTIVRSIRTGHAGSKTLEDIAAAAFLIAAGEHPDHPEPELIYLADDACSPIDMTPRVLGNRRGTLQKAIEDIGAGSFPTDPSNYKCPKCPAFFFCGPVPSGRIQKKFG